ncbi:unnamed protein product [Mycena citricolor]|uniref:Uncharacterized protein n=1 Tax=Mycena citricolor TaxID=2018698 RepID=A0AAD2HG33_9AGAR|nr:unnamed protein product [Mycena citricolor]
MSKSSSCHRVADLGVPCLIVFQLVQRAACHNLSKSSYAAYASARSKTRKSPLRCFVTTNRGPGSVWMRCSSPGYGAASVRAIRIKRARMSPSGVCVSPEGELYRRSPSRYSSTLPISFSSRSWLVLPPSRSPSKSIANVSSTCSVLSKRAEAVSKVTPCVAKPGGFPFCFEGTVCSLGQFRAKCPSASQFRHLFAAISSSRFCAVNLRSHGRSVASRPGSFLFFDPLLFSPETAAADV